MRTIQRRFPRNSIRNTNANNDIEAIRSHDITTQLKDPFSLGNTTSNKSKKKLKNKYSRFLKENRYIKLLVLLISIRGAVYLLKHDDTIIDDFFNETNKYVDVNESRDINHEDNVIDGAVNKTSKNVDVDDRRNNKHDDNVIDDAANQTSKYIDVKDIADDSRNNIHDDNVIDDAVNKTSKNVDVDDSRNNKHDDNVIDNAVNKTSKNVDVDESRNNKHDDNVIDNAVNKTSKYIVVTDIVDDSHKRDNNVIDDAVNKTSKYIDVKDDSRNNIHDDNVIDDAVNKSRKYVDVTDIVDVKEEKIVFLAGIVRDVMSIKPKVWETLLEINCDQLSIGIHMVVGNGFREAMEKKEELKNGKNYVDKNCAPFMIVEENMEEINNVTNSSTVVVPENRIDRISMLRDYQRMSLRHLFIRDGGRSNIGDLVIIADLDLFRFPKTSVIKDRVSHLQKKDFEHDVLCALGILANKREPWYYDTFSTVLLPDTFLHPLSKRLYKHHYEGENEKLVRSDNQYGPFTQGHIFNYFLKKGKEATSGVVSVRSCFGGFAMYRANVYFNNECQYRIEGERELASSMKYAGSKDERPCEHIVFHDCLKTKTFETSEDAARIAVDPNLITMWKQD